MNTNTTGLAKYVKPLDHIDPVDRLLERLNGVTKEGTGWKARCPCAEKHTNGDQHPSLGIDRGEDGRVLLVCRSQHCSASEIVQALGLELRDLYGPAGSTTEHIRNPPRVYSSPESVIAALQRQPELQGSAVTQHVYGDSFIVLRFDFDDGGKTFRPL